MKGNIHKKQTWEDKFARHWWKTLKNHANGTKNIKRIARRQFRHDKEWRNEIDDKD